MGEQENGHPRMVALDPNHSHFILVDSGEGGKEDGKGDKEDGKGSKEAGKGGEEDGEVKLRAAVEDYVRPEGCEPPAFRPGPTRKEVPPAAAPDLVSEAWAFESLWRP